MNVRQKLSLAAMCIALPALASAQAAPAPAADAPAFSITPYGFVLLTYNQSDGTFKYPEYPSVISSEGGHANHLSARQSRFGWNFKNMDAGFLGAKSLSAKLEFDFMGATGSAMDSAIPRLRYAYGVAEWAGIGPGTLSVLAGQTDGLVNALHPELGAYVALPMFMQAGNLTMRAPQIRASYMVDAGMIAVTAEVAALNANDTVSTTTSTGNASGQPALEARLQGVAKPMADVKATIGVGYHTNVRTFDANTALRRNKTTSLVGVDANIEATKYLNLRGEWFTGKGTDDSQSGAFAAYTGSGNTLQLTKTTGFWIQAVLKPIPQLWVMGGYGQEKSDLNTSPSVDTTYSMTNVGLIAPVSKNWRLGLEYTMSKKDNPGTTPDLSGSEVALSSRFMF